MSVPNVAYTAVLKDGIDFYEKDMDEVKHLRPIPPES
jgi:hypothetical protein